MPGLVSDPPSPRVHVVVSFPVPPGVDPGEAALEVVHAVRKAAPDAEVYYQTSEGT